MLQFFGIADRLYIDELDVLRRELRELALAEEYAEVERIVTQDLLELLLN